MPQQKTVTKKIIQSLLFVPIVFASVFSANAQSQANIPVPVSTDSIRKARPNLDKPDKNGVYMVVDKMPSYPGGEKALLAYIGSNLRYPVIAQENGIQGTVIVRFVVTNNGSVDKIEVVRSLDPACDKEAVRVLSSMASWTPGEQNGKKVSVYYTLPIKYKLMGNNKSVNVAQPIYVVDGKIITKAELDLIKPTMIKEVNVLKDASATAIYGDKGKNGVVLITLKEGKSGEVTDSVKTNVSKDNRTFEVVEQMPEYPGGVRALLNFIGANLRYPVEAQKARIQGRVIVRFVVNKAGQVEKEEVIRSLSPECDRESLRVIRMMPDWKPGMQKGKTVSVWYTLPIQFKLN
jgi:TonB family C-terminal domain